VNSSKKRQISSWRDFSAELKRRRVYPVVAAYAVIAFVILQVAEITFEPLGIPNWVMIALIAALSGGFPIAVILSWIYDFSWTGIRKDSDQWAASSVDENTASIAVLPFTDMSPEQDQGFFCEGIAEEILNALTKIKQLDVTARSSSFAYSAGAADIRHIGRELGVGTVLEGSVRKSGNRVRITAQLIKTKDGYHLWSKSFDEELHDVFAIQDEIATNIAEALLETLTPTQHARIRSTPTTNVEAYEYYLKGRQFFKRFRKKDIEYAREMFHQAIQTDENYAPAWAGYADCHSFLVMYVDPKPGYRETAQEASARAVELAPDLAEAHAARGLSCLVNEDFDAAEREFETALELNPRLFEAHYYFARTRFHQGRLDEAMELFRSAAEVDPSDYQSRCLRIQMLRGTDHLDQAKAEAREALEVLERHLKLNPDDARAYHLGAGTLVVLGDIDRAKEWLHRAIEIDPDDPIVQYNVACNLATLCEIDDSIRYLKRVVNAGTISAAWIRNDEDLANLRGDPRFEKLLQTLGETKD
jgi:TolB-like protein/Flp pilus assembly protein TadD